jgi:hypothetical protein
LTPNGFFARWLTFTFVTYRHGCEAMSVRKDPRSPYWHYDFQISGRRFYGSTKARTERDAEAVERAVRERARNGHIQPRKRS